MSLASTKASPEYIEAKAATTDIEPPSIGFAVPAEYKTGTLASLGAVIKQNNTILYLLTKHSQEIASIRESLNKIQKRIEAGNLQDSKPKDFSDAITDLTKRLENFSITGAVPPTKKKGPIYFYEDPVKIFKEQFAKEKR